MPLVDVDDVNALGLAEPSLRARPRRSYCRAVDSVLLMTW